MSKVKKEGANHYEMLYIVPSKYTEDEVKVVVGKIEKIVTDNGGAITGREEWGNKKLAYKIKQFSFGYYFVLEFDLEGKMLERVNMLIRTSNEVLRHQVVVKKIKSKEEIAREKKISAKIEAKKAEEIKQQLIEEEKGKPVEKTEKDSDKVELKDLDEKLDRLLDTEDLL